MTTPMISPQNVLDRMTCDSANRTASGGDLTMSKTQQIAAWSAVALCSLWLAGCSAGFNSSVAAPIATTHIELQGSVHGGQQPVSGATIGLYVASTGGYGSSLQNILTAPVSTSASGGFSITGDYTCTAGQQMYLTATGGNTGQGVNSNSAIMAALGNCSQLSASTYINANELTTVASVFALAPFMSSATALGTSSTNVAGLTRAFASVHKLVNTTTGSAPGDLLPAGAVAPTAELNTLADILAACVNTTGDTGSGTPCHQLFTLLTPAGGTAPTDTIGAALAIAKNPTLNVSSLFSLIPSQSPFQPTLSAAPTDWTIAVTYSGSFNKPATTAVDSSGNIWVANTGNNTVEVLAQTGMPAIGTALSGNGLSAPVAVAIDASGNAWVANSTGTTLSAFTVAGAPVSGSPFTPDGISHPVSLAFDATGNIWVANSGNDSVSQVSSSGTAIQQISGATAPNAIAINPK
jgi:hypothetical protein